MRFINLFFILVLTPILTVAQPKYETRAVWLTTIGGIDWPHTYATSARSAERQKQELRDILDRLSRAGINTVLLQTRIRATTIYPSSYEPWDGCLSGKPAKSPGYDALRFAADECHARGMELHAWIVAIPVGKWNSTGCRRLRKRMPDIVRKIGDEGYLNPEKEQTAAYLASLCEEITRGYDIDGVHLDYIRYPETWPLKRSRQRARDNITSIVRAVSRRVKSIKPWVKVSCAAIGKHDDLTRYSSRGWNAYSTVCQDVYGWLESGLVDEVFPMMYFRGNQFFPFALDWRENDHGRTVVPGLGLYMLSPRERDWPASEITRQIQVARRYGMGHAYFRSKFLTDDTKGIYNYLRENVYTAPALVPPMTWEHAAAPKAPAAIGRVKRGDGTETLRWQRTDNDTAMTMYNVYSSRVFPVDVSDANNLIMARLRRDSIIIPSDGSRHYAVTATNRFGNESAPAQEAAEPEEPASAPVTRPFLACDGETLQLPDWTSKLDAQYITVETVLGQMVDIRLYTGAALDVRRLDDGVYVLRSIGKKGRSHRLGHFAIRRRF